EGDAGRDGGDVDDPAAVAQALRDTFGVDLPVPTIYQDPTLRSVASAIDAAAAT
ncbi:phosphopantetheine-binding protein, partial [Streptomyces rochei]|uniref:phosphopantetheine-binding protein n=1 Tax=Streptomyces rochei TaxID=1928 RepID=UPI0033B9F011